MSQDESLRLAATVVDGFTGPLKNLRAQMQVLAREGAGHTETLEKSFGKATAAMRQAEQAAASGLNPALKTVGITSLTATAAILGVGAAMRSFVSGAASLGALSRETGQTAENLRNFGAVASKFGVDQEAVAAGTKNFATQMREFGRGIGETYQWLNRQGRDASQRKHFQDFAADLRATTDRGEQLRKVLTEMENIKDPVERGMFAEKFFGNTDFGRLGDKHFGPILEMWKKTAQKLGPLDPAAVESAERFERSMADLGSSMRKLGTTIGQEVLPYAERFTTWLSDIVSDQRGGAIAAIRENLSGVKRELDQINWTQFGKDSLSVLKETTSLAGNLAIALHRIAEALRALREDKKIEAFRHLDGASGPLARRLAPLPGDDKIERDEQADVLRGKIGTAQEQGALQAELLKELQERGDKEGVKRLTDAMEANAKQLKALQDALGKLTSQGGATVQQQSFDGSGFGGGLGGLIQKAAFGGGGGGYGGGQTLGERLFGRPTGANAAGDPYRQRRMDALRNDPSAEWRMRIGRGETGVPLPGGTSPGGGAGRAGRALRGGQGDGLYGSDGARGGGAAQAGRELRGEGKAARGSLAANQQEAYAAARAEGLSDTAARALVANMSGESLRNPRDHHWDRSHMSQGIVQWDPQRAERIRRQFGAYPKDMSVTDQTRAAIWEMKTRPEYAPTWRALQGDHPGQMLDALVRNFERPQFKEKAIAERSAFYRGFTPNERRPDVADARANADAADGSGFAAAFKRRQQDEDARREGLRLSDGAQGALRAGAGGGAKVEVNGSMTTVIRTRDPGTQVSHSASGNLFREIVQSRGRQMAAARDDG